MTTIEIPVSDELYEKLAERARVHGRTVEEQALAELEGDIEQERRKRRRIVLDQIRALPPIKSSLDPATLIREDRDR
jgi:hypothetical protein